MQGSFAIYEDGLEKVVFTSRITPEDLEALESLQYSPMTFQACIPKALELRVTVVGHQIFSAEIDSQAQATTALDWRRDGRGLIGQWQRHALPADLEARILRLMDAFGLNYGAMDFILTPEGRYVFLEVNPAGEFMWLQKHPGLPIAEALADVLLGRVPRRTEPEWALLGQGSAPSAL
jgi:glutathione synthase/RimK-type ligase-like ATP-grasp enzyme